MEYELYMKLEIRVVLFGYMFEGSGKLDCLFCDYFQLLEDI
jgi:hypothetical protein